MSGNTILVDILGYKFYQCMFAIALCFLPYVLLWYIVAATCGYALYRTVVYAWETFASKRIAGDDRAVLITGCDSGFGFMFARRFEALGFTVFAGCSSDTSQGARHLRATLSRRLHVVEVDVTRDESVANGLAYVKRNLPRKGLWGIINNAGINMLGEVELSPVSLYQKAMDVNFYGAVRVTKESIPLLRASKGRIINISSVHGRMALPRQSMYEVSKHALETMSDSLRLEMAKFGVKVSIVQPGAFAHATSVANETNIRRFEKDADEMWENASEDVKETYTKEYLTSQIPKQPTEGSWPPDDDAGRDVITAVEHALCSEIPRQRYYVWGRRTAFFMHITGQLYHLTPTWIMDTFITWWTKAK